MNLFPSWLLALVLAGACVPASAQSFVCGGVGVDEQQRMKADASGHDLMLTFATSSGAYLADVAVRIADGRGAAVLEATCGGPIMLVDLPAAGTYQITATSSGASQQRSVSVTRTKRPASATFVWRASGS